MKGIMCGIFAPGCICCIRSIRCLKLFIFKACKSVSTHKKIACIKYNRTCFFNAHNGKNSYKVLASDSLWKLSEGFGNRSPRLNKAQHFDSVILNSSQSFLTKSMLSHRTYGNYEIIYKPYIIDIS